MNKTIAIDENLHSRITDSSDKSLNYRDIINGLLVHFRLAETLNHDNIIRKVKEYDKDAVLINKGNLDFAISKYNQEQDPIKKASALAYYIVSGHPFSNGNKRIGFWLFLRVLDEANYKLLANPSELKNIIFGLASGNYSYAQFIDKIRRIINKKESFNNLEYFNETVLKLID